jgi:hypothetical protein
MNSLTMTEPNANGANPKVLTLYLLNPDELEELNRTHMLTTTSRDDPVVFMVANDTEDAANRYLKIIEAITAAAGVPVETFDLRGMG